MRSTLFILLLAASACTDSGSSDDGAAAECVPHEYANAPLTIAGVAPEIDLLPGATRQLDVSVFVGFGANTDGPTVPVEACDIAWSVSGPGATVDDNGLLTIDPASPSGSKRTVTATVKTLHNEGNAEDPEDGGVTVGTPSVDVWTYTTDAMPQKGTWHETMRTGCSALTESAPPDGEAINELVIFASGLTWVTWQPFEVYIDYWSTATFAQPAITLGSPAGNYVPTDADLDGNFAIDNGDLLLTNMFLGSKHPGIVPADICGHRFAKN